MRGRNIKIFVVLVLIGGYTYAQGFMSPNAWKKFRHEIYLGGGASNFLGDLGGRDQIGKDYSYADLELALTKPSVTLGYRYRVTKHFGWRTDFNYMRIWGNDALTKEPARNNRNLSFRSPIVELSTLLELEIPISKIGNRYHIKKTMKRRFKSSNQLVYAFIGVGGFYFNPQANYHGKWVNLQPLSTEGQGLPGGVPKYQRVSVSIPFGAGYRINVSKQWTLGIEYNFRKTFTDYIDDVHGVYYDKDLLKQYVGQMAADLSDPNKGDIPGATITGEQRGDLQFDSYMCVEIKVGYLLKQQKKHKKTRAKF